jgi:hypothetical protein
VRGVCLFRRHQNPRSPPVLSGRARRHAAIPNRDLSMHGPMVQQVRKRCPQCLVIAGQVPATQEAGLGRPIWSRRRICRRIIRAGRCGRSMTRRGRRIIRAGRCGRSMTRRGRRIIRAGRCGRSMSVGGRRIIRADPCLRWMRRGGPISASRILMSADAALAEVAGHHHNPFPAVAADSLDRRGTGVVLPRRHASRSRRGILLTHFHRWPSHTRMDSPMIPAPTDSRAECGPRNMPQGRVARIPGCLTRCE